MSTTLTPNTREEQDAAHDPYETKGIAKGLQDLENHANAGTGIDQAEAYANDPENASKNIQDVTNKEQARPGYTNNFTGGGASISDKLSVKELRKRGPIGLIIAVIIALAGIGSSFGPAGAFAHFKEIYTQKVDTLSSILETRKSIKLGKRIFATNAACKIKVRCRFVGLNEEQMKVIKEQGGQVLDEKGKPVTMNEDKKYVGGKTLVLEGGEKIDAGKYNSKVRSSAGLRSLSRALYSAQYQSFNDYKSKEVRVNRKLVTNPKFDENDPDGTKARQSINKALSGQPMDASATDNAPLDENKKPPAGSSQADLGQGIEAIKKESEKLSAAAAAGKPIDTLPSDIASVTNLPDIDTQTGLQKVVGFLNPADIAVGMCSTYQFSNVLLTAQKVYLVAQAAIYASIFLSAADKLKAGEAQPADIEKPMNILTKEDPFGDGFGESPLYQYAAYGIPGDKEIQFGLAGGAVMGLITTAIQWVNDHTPGGKAAITNTCKILQNPFTQVGLALTTFIPGEGQAMTAVSQAFAKGGAAAARKAIQDAIKNLVTKDLSKEALKGVAKDVGKSLGKMAATSAGIFVAGYMITKYMVPYLARVMSNTYLTGNENGVMAADTIFTGIKSTAIANGLEHSNIVLSKSEDAKFQAYRSGVNATYIADMRRQADPLDVTDPYSAANSFAASFYQFGTKMNVLSNFSKITNVPSTIFNALSFKQPLLATAYASSANDFCTSDDYITERNLASAPDCSVITGIPDPSVLNLVDDEIEGWMINNGYVNAEDGSAIAGTDYEKFTNECTQDKVIGDVGEPDKKLSDFCFTGDNNRKARMFSMFAVYDLDNIIDETMDGKANDPAGDAIAQGSAKELAQQLLDSPNVSYNTPQRKEELKYIAETGKARQCGAPTVLPKLLGLLVSASKHYKISIGVIVDSHGCDGGRHPDGMAVDLNGVQRLNQPAKTQMTWTAAETDVARDFYEYLDSISTKGNLGLGQRQCFGGRLPQLQNTNNYDFFNDTCHHIHIDVRKK